MCHLIVDNRTLVCAYTQKQYPVVKYSNLRFACLMLIVCLQGNCVLKDAQLGMNESMGNNFG